MNKSDFNFDLPEHLIAQTPLEKRANSKMMIVNSKDNTLVSDHFYNIKKLFKKGDTLVLNDTKVIPARLFGVKEETGARVEILLLKEVVKDRWETLVGNAKVVKLDTIINVSDKLYLKCTKILENGEREFSLSYEGDLYSVLHEIGNIPLPPYIKEQLEDDDRYQTVYAKNRGSAAAPTAGLHFTKEVLKELKDLGVNIHYITLHVGLGTFLPMKVDDINDHNMHSETYEISEETARALNLAKKNKTRIIAVGSTSIRTLESNYKKFNKFKAERSSTSIFIYPGIEILSSDVMITNFHLPESTLMMLVSAFGGYDLLMEAYKKAVREEYRFFSFGDMMWIE